MEILTSIWNGILETSLTEWIAVISGIIYVLLAGKKHIACWFFAMVSTSIYIYLCFSNQLFVESGLQVFYLIMAIYGWVKWNQDQSEALPIRRWKWSFHVINILISTAVTLLLGYLMGEFTSQQSPYLDAFTTVFSLAATFMVTQRVLENWLYWIVIDIALGVLYASRELYLTGVQYIVFAIIAVFAFYSWRKYYSVQRSQRRTTHPEILDNEI